MAAGKTWNRRLALAGGAALAAGGAGLALRGGQPQRRQIAAPGVYRRGNVAEPETLDPIMSSGFQEFEIIGDLMVGLMAQTADAKPFFRRQFIRILRIDGGKVLIGKRVIDAVYFYGP